MYKKGKRIELNKNEDDKIAASSLSYKGVNMNTHLMIAWLLSSLLFFLFSRTIVPFFWDEDFQSQNLNIGTIHTVLGIIGIFTYFIEPIISVLYRPKDDNEQSNKKTSLREQNLFPAIINNVLFMILLLPMGVISFLRPVFRALILYTSFSFLNLPGGESPLFVTIVGGDILLYYLNNLFPSWKLSPANFVISYFKITQRPVLLKISVLFFILFTAIVYSFWLKVGYYSEPGHKALKGEREILLLFSWFFATIYIRMPFIPDDLDIIALLKKMPAKMLLFQIITLVISFAGYMWDYFTSWT